MSPRESGPALLPTCGSPLSLNDYFAETLKDQITGTIQDREVPEVGRPTKILLQAWASIQLISGMVIGLLVLTGAALMWKASHFGLGITKQDRKITG
jgi:hypothetical protein